MPFTSFSFEFDSGPHGCKASFIRSKHSFSVTPALEGGSRQGALRIAAGLRQHTPPSFVPARQPQRCATSVSNILCPSCTHMCTLSKCPSLSFFRHFLCQSIDALRYRTHIHCLPEHQVRNLCWDGKLRLLSAAVAVLTYTRTDIVLTVIQFPCRLRLP